MKKPLILAIFALSVGAGFGMSVPAHAADNVNFITVSSCEQVGSDIRISRNNGPKHILTSSCRDAGHGKRLYKMTCISSKQYKVEWTTPTACTGGSTTSDTIAPSVSMSANKSTVSNNESVTLTVTASDAKGVTKIEIREGSTVVKTCSGSNLTSCAHTFVAVGQQNTERAQTFTAKAYDAAGNVGTSSSVIIRTRATNVDTTRPEVTISANKATIQTGEKVTITTHATDTSGISKLEIYQNGVKVKTCENRKSCSYTTEFSQSTVPNSATYSFYAKAIDMKGNVQQSNTVQVTVTNVYTLTASLSQVNYTVNSIPWVRARAHANASEGIARIEIYGIKNGTTHLGKRCSWNTKPKSQSCAVEYPRSTVEAYLPFAVYAKVTDVKGHTYITPVTTVTTL